MRGDRRLPGLAAALAIVALVCGAMGCGGGADERQPAPNAGTLRLIPATALVALHLSTDGERDAVVAAGRTAARLPSWPRLRDDLLRRLDAPGCGLDVRRRPGTETTLALLPGGRSARTLLVTDAPASGLGTQPRPCGALVARRIGRFVAIGEPATVLTAAAVADDPARSLAAAATYRRAAAGLPRDRVLDAWVSGAGARRLLAPLGGVLGTVGSLLDEPGLRGAAAGLSPREGGAHLTIRRVGSGAAGSATFAPTLQRRAPADTIAYVASGDLTAALQQLLVLAGSDAARAVTPLLRDGGAPLDTLGRLGRESAALVTPGDQGPVVTLLARVQDGPRARTAMRALEPALATLFGRAAGAAFSGSSPGAGAARTLGGAGGQGVTWAVDGSMLIVSSVPSGVTAIRARGGRLATSDRYRRSAGNTPIRIRSLVFLDPDQLLQLGADGLVSDPALQGVRRDLAHVRAITAYAAGAGNVSTVDITLSIT